MSLRPAAFRVRQVQPRGARFSHYSHFLLANGARLP